MLPWMPSQKGNSYAQAPLSHRAKHATSIACELYKQNSSLAPQQQAPKAGCYTMRGKEDSVQHSIGVHHQHIWPTLLTMCSAFMIWSHLSLESCNIGCMWACGACHLWLFAVKVPRHFRCKTCNPMLIETWFAMSYWMVAQARLSTCWQYQDEHDHLFRLSNATCVL